MPTVENYIDADTGLRTLEKDAETDRLFDIDLSGIVRTGDTISNFVSPVGVTNLGKVSGSSDITASGETHNSAQMLQLRISGGTAGEHYRIDFVATTVGGGDPDTLTGPVLLKVT